jgi:hypothetical protein
MEMEIDHENILWVEKKVKKGKRYLITLLGMWEWAM